MSETLSDPDKPAHAIMGRWVDGSPMRNDGVVLQDANQNPWYVLATVHGEQAENAKPWRHNEELAAQNRAAWNLWYCHDLNDEDLQDRAQKVGLTPEDLVPFKDGKRDVVTNKKTLASIRRKIIKRLKDAGAEDTSAPDPAQNIMFSQVHFSKYLTFEKVVFDKNCYFDEAVFTSSAVFISAVFTGDTSFISSSFMGYTYFSSTTFTGDAYFSSATFTGTANFISAAFTGYADFISAAFKTSAHFDFVTFTGHANFISTTFTGSANFVSTTFTGDADFQSATFMGNANFNRGWTFDGGEQRPSEDPTVFQKQAEFSSAKFKSTTTFEEARFLTHVPEFHAAELYDDTAFTLPDDYSENWPLIVGDGVMAADKQKKAYNRLRYYMSTSLQIDEEQFFHRMEMRCKRETENSTAMKLLYDLFEGVSGYGSSVSRPVKWLSVVWFVGWVAYLQKSPIKFGEAPVWEAAGWSFANIFPFFGLQTRYFDDGKLNSAIQVVGGAQTVVGFALLFLLGLGLRNRFRLR